ncbi:MAG: HAMP domain-containing histidine kinase [Kribbellaceae bacterium]|nr:HAMP domain-containing histidine kinase [Kribbellaceae bacterium]
MTLAAVLAVSVALVAGALILVVLLGSVLTKQECADAKQRATQLAAERVPSPGVPGELVQWIASDGSIVGGATPLARPRSACVVVEPAGYGEDFVFASAAIDHATGPAVAVVVGRPLVDVLDSTRFVRRVLVIGVPGVMLVVGAVTWIVTGRILAPVTAIRRQVDEISGSELHRRVPAVRRDEVGRLAGTMNRMLERLQRSDEDRRRFVSDASHELRSPIATIRQYAEVAAAHPDRVGTAELADAVRTESCRLERLVEDLLLLAKADERTADVPRAAVDLDDLVFVTARRLRASCEPAIDTTAVSAGQVRGDAEQLGRMVGNLADNAVRFAASRVVFELTEYGGIVVLTVSDDGPGIPPADRSRVFGRFVRLDPGRSRDSGGAGLGLAIVAEIVRRHHGTVAVRTSGAGGATFEVRLPSADAVQL